MTKVSFYKLAGEQPMAMALICQLAQKAIAQHQQVLCLVPDKQAVTQLDEYMWNLNESTFIPHGTGVDQAPIAISCDPEPGNLHQILVNLTTEIPTWFSRFERVIEIIYQDVVYEEAKRTHFRFYKERGYPLSFHDLSESFTG